MTDARYDRRAVLKIALTALPIVTIARNANAEQTLPHMDENESLARAMGYTHDAKKIDPDKVPQYKAGSTCGNCMQLQGKDGEEWRPCALFAGKLVSAHGWCKVWQPKAA
ncbi:MAG: high-potential iron-sulfur protein [Steroidobacter sp.]